MTLIGHDDSTINIVMAIIHLWLVTNVCLYIYTSLAYDRVLEKCFWAAGVLESPGIICNQQSGKRMHTSNVHCYPRESFREITMYIGSMHTFPTLLVTNNSRTFQDPGVRLSVCLSVCLFVCYHDN